MKQTITSFLLLSLLVFFGCSGNYYTETEVHKRTRIRTLPEFYTLNISGNFEVMINAQSTQKIEIVAEDDILPYVVTEVHNKELNISTTKDLGKNAFVELRISMEKLKEINSSGVTEIVVNNLNSEKFELNVSGAADLVANGNANNFIINVSGASDVNAKNLKSKTVDVNISGAAEIVVNAVNKLDVDISGMGDIKYTGSPSKISKDISGFGTVSKLE